MNIKYEFKNKRNPSTNINIIEEEVVHAVKKRQNTNFDKQDDIVLE